MRRTLALFCVVSIFLSCTPSPPRTQLPDDIAACEAVFLPWWNTLKAEDRKAIRAVYFPDTGAVVFPNAFFDKYAGTSPPIMRNSELKSEAIDGKDWFWQFSELRRIETNTFEMDAGYYCGGLCARHCSYRVGRQTDGTWKIVGGGNSCVVS